MRMIDSAEVQGNVLYAYGDAFRHAEYILLRITDAASARDQLRRWFSLITFGRRPWKMQSDGHIAEDVFGEHLKPPAELAQLPHLNVAFTYAGLQRLGVPAQMLYAFPREFREGARHRARANGDRGASAADNWVDGLGTGDILITVHATNSLDRDRFAERVLSGSDRALSKMHDLRAARLKSERELPAVDDGTERRPFTATCDVEYDREHFGFADGCSQPAIEGVHDDPTGTGVYAAAPPCWWRPLRRLEVLLQDLGVKPIRRYWRGLRAGEFLLGYENEDGRLPVGPPPPLGPGGLSWCIARCSSTSRRSIGTWQVRPSGSGLIPSCCVRRLWGAGRTVRRLCCHPTDPIRSSPSVADARTISCTNEKPGTPEIRTATRARSARISGAASRATDFRGRRAHHAPSDYPARDAVRTA